MQVIPSGSVAVPLYQLRRMTALSPTFQRFTKSQTWRHALTRLKFKEVEGNEQRPIGVINTESTMFTKIAGGAQAVILPQGSLFLWLALDTPDEFKEDTDGEYLNYCNFHGLIGDEIAALSGADQEEDSDFPDSHLIIKDMHDVPPTVSPKEFWTIAGIGRYMWSAWIVEWGDE